MCERNRCLDAGCKIVGEEGKVGTACCIHNWLEFATVKEMEEFSDVPWSPDNKVPPTPDCTAHIKELNPFSDRNTRPILVFKRCPRLGPDGNCMIEDKKPEACRQVQIGDTSCAEFRKRNGLTPIK